MHAGQFYVRCDLKRVKKKTCTRLKWPKIFDTSVTINFYKDQGHDGKRPAVLSLR